MNLRRKHIRELADSLLESAGCIGPSVNVEWIAKNHGVVVHKQEVQEDVSGYLLRDVQRGFAVIGVNKRHHSNRQRFTMAHELGHYLLHKASEIHVDHGFQLKHRNQRSGEGTDLDEMEANLFAAELLMPEKFLRENAEAMISSSVDSEEQLEKLAKQYGVSQQAMAIRLSSLGYLAV